MTKKTMKYGHFDDKNKEYVITTPKTPSPWINYLGNDNFFSIISNTSGGYSFYKDARFRRITRYRYNNVPLDMGGKYFYINEEGTVWSPAWKPAKTDLDKYECRHGLGYSTIEGSKNELTAKQTSFVPLGFNGEVNMIELKNNSAKAKSFKFYSLVEFALWDALTDMTNFQRNLSVGEMEIDGSTIYHKTEYRERRNHFAFYHVNSEIKGFDTDRDTFLGDYNGWEKPQVVEENRSQNSHAHGWYPIASHCIEVVLKPGETKELVFLLGYTEMEQDDKWESLQVINKTSAKAQIAQFDTSAKAKNALAELNHYWDNLLSVYQVKSHDEKLDRMVNIWNQYQNMVTFNMSRSTSFYESGIGRGMGFRDSNQDLIGFVHLIPEKAKQRILDIAATQFEDGSAYHQYQPLTKKGNADIGGNFNDDPLWLILSTSAYMKETGDFSILDESVPFDNDSSKAESLFEHLNRSFYFTVKNLGPHKLPLIGRADWNDCLNLNCFSNNPDESFQTTGNKTGGVAESVFIAGMFVIYGKEFAKICELKGKKQEAETVLSHVNEMIKAVEEHGWDGDWYLRAYDYYGGKIGSNENEEGKIFIESQGFCTMAQIGAENGKTLKALDSVDKYLNCDYGIVLNNPAFTKYDIKMGEITTYPEGYKENAGIFCHNNPWIMIGETLEGRGNKAFEYYSKITPAYLEDIQALHKTEPYVYSQMIAGKDAFKPGEAKNSWLTGTAAWNFYAISQYILGIQPDYYGLKIDACIPTDWKGYTVSRKFRNAVYNIKFENPDGISKGIKRIMVDGKLIDGNILPIFEDKKTHEVLVIL